MPQIPMIIQVCKSEKDLAEKEGRAEVGKHLSGANFPVLVHGDHTTVHNSAGIGRVKEQASPVEGDQDHQKNLKAPPISIKVQKSTHADSFT